MRKLTSYLLIISLAFTMAFSGTSLAFAAGSTDSSDTGKTISEEGSYVEDEVLVVFEDKVNEKKAENIVEDADVEIENIEMVSMPEDISAAAQTPYVVTLDDRTSVEEAVEELEDDSDVAYAQPNYLYQLDEGSVSPNSLTKAARASSATQQWNLDIIDTQEAWDLIDEVKGPNADDSEKVTVAVLDTGVNMDSEERPELALALEKHREQCVDITEAGNVGNENFSNGIYNKLDKTSSYYEENDLTPNPETNRNNGHGTRVAGNVAAANGIGVCGVAAGNNNNVVDLVAVDIYKEYTSSDDRYATSEDVARGIEYVIQDDINAKVINMSIGFVANRSGENDQLVQNAIDKATEGGTTVVCSAGNDNTTSLWYPSDLDNVIGVISTVNYDDPFDKCKAPTSNYGDNKDICAPGAQVPGITTANLYSGTSYASPIVAGVAAMMYYVNPDLTPAEVLSMLKETATDLYTEGDDIYTRCGNVNAYGAVAAAAGKEIDNTPKLSAPTGIKAESAGYNKIQVSWNKVSDARGYHIYRSKSANGTYSLVHSVSGGATRSYTNSGLTSGTTYYFKVAAYGVSGHKKAYSAQSAAVSAKPTISAPTGLYVGNNTYKRQAISWNKLANASGYAIYRATSKGGSYKCIKTIRSGSTTSFISRSGITPGKTYYYKIRAFRTNRHNVDAYGSYSSAKSRRAAPKKPVVTVKKYSSRSAKISWKRVTTVSGYAISRSTKRNGKYKRIALKKAGTSRYVIDRNLKRNKRYYYKVRAYKTYKGKKIYSLYSTPKSIRIK